MPGYRDSEGKILVHVTDEQRDLLEKLVVARAAEIRLANAADGNVIHEHRIESRRVEYALLIELKHELFHAGT